MLTRNVIHKHLDRSKMSDLSSRPLVVHALSMRRTIDGVDCFGGELNSRSTTGVRRGLGVQPCEVRRNPLATRQPIVQGGAEVDPSLIGYAIQ